MRRYEWADGSGPVEARIYAPEKRGEHFSCLVELSGIGRAVQKRKVMGVDSLQALRLGLEMIRYALEPIAMELRWLDGSQWLDLPRYVPAIFGDSRDERFQRAIDDEMDRLSRENGEDPVALHALDDADKLKRRKQQLGRRTRMTPVKKRSPKSHRPE